jgi:hypothetical protein
MSSITRPSSSGAARQALDCGLRLGHVTVGPRPSSALAIDIYRRAEETGEKVTLGTVERRAPASC